MSRSRSSVIQRCAAGLFSLASFLIAPGAAASEFALAVSPPRFELELKPGERSRQVMEITNASAASTSFAIKTADWLLGMPSNSVGGAAAMASGLGDVTGTGSGAPGLSTLWMRAASA